MTLLDDAVQDVRKTMPRPKGAYGRRHHSRGLRGFFDNAENRRRPCVELAGWDLVEALLEAGDEAGAEKLYEQLTR